jgi:hypothetical protein
MASPYSAIIAAVTQKDWVRATESVSSVLQQKMAERLATERTSVAQTLVKEATESWPTIAFVRKVTSTLVSLGWDAVAETGMSGHFIMIRKDPGIWEASFGTNEAETWVGNIDDGRNSYVELDTHLSKSETNVSVVVNAIRETLKKHLKSIGVTESLAGFTEGSEFKRVSCLHCGKKMNVTKTDKGPHYCSYCRAEKRSQK